MPEAEKAYVIAAVGSFDGIHLGHQKLIREVLARRNAAKVPALGLIMSFYPHPDVLIGRVKEMPALTTLRQKAKLLSALGIDVFCLRHFNKKLSNLSYKEFIDQVLVSELGVNELVLGPDARFGRGGEGSVERIVEYCTGRGPKVVVLPFETQAQERKVSSGLIRRLVESGELDEAKSCLGRSYSVEGRVVRGDRRGGPLGIPTLNLRQSSQVHPPKGVYASFCRIEPDGKVLKSVTNIGTRPTFGGVELRIETHVLDALELDRARPRVEVFFVSRIRDEIRFKDANALVSQIKKDVDTAKKILRNAVPLT